MELAFSEGSLIFAHPLRVTVRNVSDIIDQALTLASLKDAKSGKYLLSNRFEPEFSGLTPEEIVGLTVDDLNVGLLKGSKPALVNAIKTMDKKAFLSIVLMALTSAGFDPLSSPTFRSSTVSPTISSGVNPENSGSNRLLSKYFPLLASLRLASVSA